ncbi:MAG: DUF169 domain-containing protein [Coriobacteriia bacterium]
MHSNIVDKLKFDLKPVAISFTDKKPANALQYEEGKRGCVAAMLVAAAKNGKTAVFDEKTYGCPGGGVGLCFGDAFTRGNHPTEYLLSTGDKALTAHGKTYSKSLGRGERFFATPELAGKWKAAFPYSEAPEKYVVFTPLSKVEEEPDIICIFANPDQLSALVSLAGFSNGEALNVIAPFVAACHSIAYAYREIGTEHPVTIMGFFDISQRHRIPRELLSFTVPYRMFKEMDEVVEESCLTTEAWVELESRRRTS